MPTPIDDEFEFALKILTGRVPSWDVEALRLIVTQGPEAAQKDSDYAAHLRRFEEQYVGRGADGCSKVRYEALLTVLESATRRKPSEGIQATVWHCLRDFEPRAWYAELFLQETWNLLWGDLGTHAPGAGNSSDAERTLGERGRRVIERLLFDAEFRGRGRPLATVGSETADEVRTLWPQVKTELGAARRALREDPDSPLLRRLVERLCPDLSTREQRTLRRKLSIVDGQPTRSVASGADLILGTRFKIPARRVRALRPRRPAQ